MLDRIQFLALDSFADDYELSFEDHLARHGYGPHEFYITPAGVEEIQRPEYEAYLEP